MSDIHAETEQGDSPRAAGTLAVIARGKLWANESELDYRELDLHIYWDGEDFDISIPDEEGEQGQVLVSVPVEGIVAAMARRRF